MLSDPIAVLPRWLSFQIENNSPPPLPPFFHNYRIIFLDYLLFGQLLCSFIALGLPSPPSNVKITQALFSFYIIIAQFHVPLWKDAQENSVKCDNKLFSFENKIRKVGQMIQLLFGKMIVGHGIRHKWHLSENFTPFVIFAEFRHQEYSQNRWWSELVFE